MAVRDYSYEMKISGTVVREGWLNDDFKTLEIVTVPMMTNMDETKAFFDLVVRIAGFMRLAGITNIKIHKE